MIEKKEFMDLENEGFTNYGRDELDEIAEMLGREDAQPDPTNRYGYPDDEHPYALYDQDLRIRRFRNKTKRGNTVFDWDGFYGRNED